MVEWSFLGFQSYEVWVMLIGAVACAATGFVGCFLVLRQMALIGDAISHSVLPGIAVGAMISGNVSSLPVLLGAGAVGVATPYLIDTLKSSGRIQEDASIGVVFTVLFSIGVILVVNMGNVHLDVDCVLSGEIATAPFDTWKTAAGTSLGPRTAWILGGVFLLDLLVISVLYKEMKICAFDPLLAESMGLRPKLMHYVLLALVSLTTIAAFEAVGAILVVAMLIAPGATAYLLTDKLSRMLLYSVLIGVLCSLFGYLGSLAFGGGISIAGSMSTVAGLLFGLAFLFSPTQGIAIRYFRRFRLRRRLMRDHVLTTLFRAAEAGRKRVSSNGLFRERFHDGQPTRKVAGQLLREGLIRWEGDWMWLTPSGDDEARKVMRAHRLWEAFLEQRVGLPADHVHRGADEMEHFLTDELQNEIATLLEDPAEDPHGRPIPKL